MRQVTVSEGLLEYVLHAVTDTRRDVKTAVGWWLNTNLPADHEALKDGVLLEALASKLTEQIRRENADALRAAALKADRALQKAGVGEATRVRRITGITGWPHGYIASLLGVNLKEIPAAFYLDPNLKLTPTGDEENGTL